METKAGGDGNKLLQGHAGFDSTAYNLSASLSFQHHVHNAVLGVVLGVLCLLTIIMNILVLVAVRKERTLHTVGNLYIVSLSLADLMVGATVMPLNLVYLLEDEWKLGPVVCRFWLVMDYVASTASIFSLFILCLDRYQSVRQPLRYLKYRTRGRATLMICFAWLLSMTWIIPILGWRMFAHVEQKPELESKCDTDFRFVTWFKVLTAILNFYIPSFLMLWFYAQIFVAVREHYQQWESVTIAKVVADDHANMQSLKTDLKTFNRMVKEENLALESYSQKDGMLDQYMLEQPYGAKDAAGRSGEAAGDKPRGRKTFFKISKPKKKAARERDDVSSVNQETASESPEKDPSLPLGFLRQADDADVKMFVSVTDCNVLVPNSVANICEMAPDADVHKHITILCNDEPKPRAPVSRGSWARDDCAEEMDAGNSMTLKQTWQKFCEQSRQCVQNMRVHKERKAVRQLGFIIGAFMACWIPYFITFMVMALCNTCVHHDLHMFTIWLGYINSTLNPFIYPLCNENFKRVFKKFFGIQQ